MNKVKWKNILAVFLCLCIFAGNSYAKDDEIETRGFITAVSDTAVTVNGVTYLLNSSTEFKDTDDSLLTLADFMVGDLVKVSGPRVGDDLIADELEKEDDLGGGEEGEEEGTSDRIIVRGVIASISVSEIVLGSSTFILNDSTKYEDDNDAPLTNADFMQGDVVKVKGYRDQNGNLVATEVEMKDEIKSGGSDDDDDSGKGDPEDIRLHCTIPNLGSVQDGLERSIEQALKEADAKPNVKVKAKIIDKDDSQKVAPPEATQGLTVAVNTTGDGPLVEVSGEAGIPTCEAILRIQIRIRGKNPITGDKLEENITQDISVTGVYAQKEKSRRRRRGKK